MQKYTKLEDGDAYDLGRGGVHNARRVIVQDGHLLVLAAVLAFLRISLLLGDVIKSAAFRHDRPVLVFSGRRLRAVSCMNSRRNTVPVLVVCNTDRGKLCASPSEGNQLGYEDEEDGKKGDGKSVRLHGKIQIQLLSRIVSKSDVRIHPKN